MFRQKKTIFLIKSSFESFFLRKIEPLNNSKTSRTKIQNTEISNFDLKTKKKHKSRKTEWSFSGFRFAAKSVMFFFFSK